MGRSDAGRTSRVARTPVPALIAALVPVAFAPGALHAQEIHVPTEVFRLDNGLTFLVNEDHSVPLVAVDVWYHVGSGYESVGRTGFAHLFEHLMFEGSLNLSDEERTRLVAEAGVSWNGSTTADRTNYFQTLSPSALELVLWMEADRMGGLLPTMTQEKLDLQRDVVQNEYRQNWANSPYAVFWLEWGREAYPQGHPYSWPTIGSLEDLEAAELSDVTDFFERFYAPNNAVIAVSGDVEPAVLRQHAEALFGWIPAGEPVEPPDLAIPPIPTTRYRTLEDRVTLPQLNLVWRTTMNYADDHAALGALAEVLARGRGSRLSRRLVFQDRIAQSVSASQQAQLLSGDFIVRVTALGDQDLALAEDAVLEEIARLAATGPEPDELARAVTGIESRLVRRVETVLGRAEAMHAYYYHLGRPDYFLEEIAAYRALTPEDIRRAAATYLDGRNRIVMSVVPEGRLELGAGEDAEP